MFYKDEVSKIYFQQQQKKNRLGRPKKIIGIEDDQVIQNLETNRRKTLATLSKNFSVSMFTIRRFGCNYPLWL